MSSNISHIRLAVLGLSLTTLVLIGRPAAAQVCGDATGDGTVTVSDGVQTLRAATQLSSSCTVATCDIDGSGSITVTDGVNVLRKAVGLPAPSSCSGGGGAAAEPAALAKDVAPLLLFGFTAISDVSLPGAAASADVAPAGGITTIDEDDCPSGGTRTKLLLGGCIINVAFTACQYSAPTLGSFQFDHVISVNFCRAQVAMHFDVTDLVSSRMVHFEGSVNFTPTGDGGILADGGPIVLTTPQGNFSLTFNQLVFDEEGHAKSGAGEITDDDNNFALARMTFTVTSPTNASVVATFDDGHQANFVLNLISGEFTPA
jgi:hypothetical protein